MAANIKTRSYSHQECGGLALLGMPGYDLQVSPTWGWTDANDSGSREYHVKFANCIDRTHFQWVDITLVTSWNTTKDKNNRITVSGTTTIRRIQITGYTPTNTNWNIVFREPNSGNQIGGTFSYNGYTSGDWWNWGSTSFSYKMNPGADSGTPTLRVTNWASGYSTESDCNKFVDKGVAGVQFHNSMAWNYDSPSISSVSCAADNGGAKFTADVKYGDTLPSSGTNSFKVEVSPKSDFSTIVWSGTKSGSGSITAVEGALASNTKYYVRYTATNKAGKTATKTCDFITLTRNSLKNPTSVRYDREMVDLSVLYGGKIYKPTTAIYYRECGASTWKKWDIPDDTAKTTTTGKILITGLKDDTCYEAQARTTTTAGTYNGNILQFRTAEKDKVSGIITSVDPYIDDDFVTHAKICFRVYGNCTPITANLEYRIKNGYSPEWIPTDEKVYPNEENTDCVVVDELIPNQTTYEVRVHAKCGVSDNYGDVEEFITPLLPKPVNYNCENYQYMVDMICQSLDAIKEGMKTIYANEDAKQLCDPYSENPTFAAMWSRVLRFMHGAICVMCDMTDVTLKSGLPGQVYMGEIGWSDIDDEVTEGSEFAVRSNGIKEAIDEAIHQVWHSHGSVTYLVQHASDLPTSGVAVGNTALVADDDYIYTYKASGWSKTRKANTDDFTVIYIEKDSDTDLGRVKAHSSWYYFGSGWQQLDADTRDLENRLDTIESTKFVKRYNAADGDILIQHNDENFNYNTLPSGKRVICFVVEDTDKPAAGMYRVSFNTGPNATIVADQDVVSGATAAKPPTDPVRIGYIFDHWEDEANPGVVFNWNTIILRNYTIKAIWNAQTCTVSYNINGGTGTTPQSQTVTYGDPYPLPSDSGFSRTGYHFNGWAKDGVPITSADLVDGDTTLTALWEADSITATFHPNNGGSDIVETTSYGGGISAFADPTKADNVFLGWFYADGTEFLFDSPLYTDVEVYAKWAGAAFTVTFQPGGGNSDFTQTVNYNATATEPTAPTWQLGGN